MHFADGWFYPEEGEWYRRIAQKIRGGNILEIGSFEGLSLSYIKDTIKSNANRIFSVEIHCRKRLVDNASKWGVELLCKDSSAASGEFPDRFFDLIYIDANHSYESVKKDIESWLPKLKMSGIIAGHDYDDHWPGVVKAVDEKFRNRIELSGRNWMVRPKIALL